VNQIRQWVQCASSNEHSYSVLHFMGFWKRMQRPKIVFILVFMDSMWSEWCQEGRELHGLNGLCRPAALALAAPTLLCLSAVVPEPCSSPACAAVHVVPSSRRHSSTAHSHVHGGAATIATSPPCGAALSRRTPGTQAAARRRRELLLERERREARAAVDCLGILPNANTIIPFEKKIEISSWPTKFRFRPTTLVPFIRFLYIFNH
jgi:hypothetical protein